MAKRWRIRQRRKLRDLLIRFYNGYERMYNNDGSKKAIEFQKDGSWKIINGRYEITEFPIVLIETFFDNFHEINNSYTQYIRPLHKVISRSFKTIDDIANSLIEREMRE